MGTRKKQTQRRPAPKGKSELATRLEAFRVKKNLTYKALASLIGGRISYETVRRAELGRTLSVRISSRIKNFLTEMEGVNRAA